MANEVLPLPFQELQDIREGIQRDPNYSWYPVYVRRLMANIDTLEMLWYAELKRRLELEVMYEYGLEDPNDARISEEAIELAREERMRSNGLVQDIEEYEETIEPEHTHGTNFDEF